MNRIACTLACIALLSACTRKDESVALGTIEWDRVELVSVAAEPIVAITVHEGDVVASGAPILEQRGDRADADLAAATAEVSRIQGVLAEQRAGARPEQLREAAARVARARAALKLAEAEQARGLGLNARGLISAAELDRLRASAELATDELAASRASEDLLRAGTRAETLAQTEAALSAAEQRAASLQLSRDRLRHRAPVAARIETLPLEVGDTPAIGATVATLLVGPQPYARVYLSPTQRAATAIGRRFNVQVAGREQPLTATVRMLSAQASFTPYYALSGDDANRLSFVAELAFADGVATELAAGLPVQATPAP